MATITFHIIGQEDRIIKTTDTLKDMWEYIRIYINIPQNWTVEELEDGVVIDNINASYLIEAFKDEKHLPVSILDIN